MCRLNCFVVISTVLNFCNFVKCSCQSDSRQRDSDESCWYTFWYVWVALGLFVTVVITIVVVYYKHKWSKKRTRVRRIAVVAPQDPPPYTAPSQQPPSYEDALKTSYPVPPGYTGGIDIHGYISVIPNRIQRNGTDDSSILSAPPSYETRNHR